MYEGKKDKHKDYSLGLHGAAMNGNVGLVKFALDHGAAIDSVVNGYMPLQLACINENHIAVVQYLIDRGADVNAQKWSKKHSVDKSQAVAGATGSTALHVACANGCTKIVDLLLRNGAKTNVRDKYSSRPVDVAAAKNHTEIVRLLETFESMEMMLQGLQEGKDHVQASHMQKKQQQQQRQGKQNLLIKEGGGRRSMDTALLSSSTKQQQQHNRQQITKSSKRDRLRRPSLPCVIEAQQQGLDIPDISTLPPPRRSFNVSVRPSPEELLMAHYPIATASAAKNNIPPSPPLELASSKSSDDSTLLMTHNGSNPGKEDWYSHGVIKQFDDENYLISLERRAYGFTSPIYSTVTNVSMNTTATTTAAPDATTADIFSTISTEGAFTEDDADKNEETDGNDKKIAIIRARTTHDSSRYNSNSNTVESASLKRCNSDGSHLRATALINNAIAANQMPPSPTSLQQQQQQQQPSMNDFETKQENSSNMDEENRMSLSTLSFSDGRNNTNDHYGAARHSISCHRPDPGLLRKPSTINTTTTYKVKRSWWPTGSRKSIDLYPAGRPSLESNPRRTSLDFRPSLDSISQFAKKSMEGLSRKSTDIMDFTSEDRKRIMANSSNSSNTASSGGNSNNRGFLSRWWSSNSNNNPSLSPSNMNATGYKIGRD